MRGTPQPLPLHRKASLVAEILVAYARVRWLLHRRDFPQTLELIRTVSTAQRNAPDATDARLARAVQRTLRVLPTDSRCLMQSLVLTSLLARRGRGSNLVIGVSPAGGFTAHAWVERAGTPLLPPREREYGRLAEL